MKRRSARSRAVFAFFLLIGVTGGLAYAWLIAPPHPAAAPDRLNTVDRDLYLRLVAAAYAADGDLALAEARLESAGPNAGSRLVELLALDLAEGRPPRDIAALTANLDVTAGAVPLLAPPRGLPAATALPAAAMTTPQATPPAVTLLRQAPLCTGDAPQLLVHVVDQRGAPLSTIALTLRGDSGPSTAYTGFSVSGDAGMVDFALEPGHTYSLLFGEVVVADGLAAPTCPGGQQGGWEIQLQMRR